MKKTKSSNLNGSSTRKKRLMLKHSKKRGIKRVKSSRNLLNNSTKLIKKSNTMIPDKHINDEEEED